MDFEYKLATDFDRAWLNFELDLPLEPMPGGKPNPFYVDRPGNPVAALEDALLRPYRRPPTCFLAGYRGSGKTTELWRLTWLPELRKRYWMLRFSADEVALARQLEAVDLIPGLAARLLATFVERGHAWPAPLVAELDAWRDWLVAQIPWLRHDHDPASRTDTLDFFARLPARVRLEPVTRAALRGALLSRCDEWVALLNQMLAAIHAESGRPLLVLVDGLHHVSPEEAEAFFGPAGRLGRLASAAVYVVSPETAAALPPTIGHTCHLLPVQPDAAGREMLRRLVLRRISPDLIQPDALERVLDLSGGSLAELRYLMRRAISETQLADQSSITVRAVETAAARVRGDYWRMLSGADYRALARVRAGRFPETPTHLLSLGAALARGPQNSAPFAVLPALEPLVSRRVEVPT